MTKRLTRTTERMKKIYSSIIIIFIFMLCLEFINIYLSNKLGTDSLYLSRVEKEVQKIKHKNLVIKAEILEYSSFESVASRAAALGFVESKKTISLFESAPVAKNNQY